MQKSVFAIDKELRKLRKDDYVSFLQEYQRRLAIVLDKGLDKDADN